MPANKARVIVDTNLLISFLLTKEHDFVVNLIAKHKLTILFSQDLLSEFWEVTQRNKFKKIFQPNRYGEPTSTAFGQEPNDKGDKQGECLQRPER
ncbi:MAG: putative toxin-antitoxin system toxin component, PIN family [Flavobacteriaceae bacterium]|nr:putative toxin-antitoxin system toxin component, PIN family [Flavobacteriaceae bacterium]